MQVDPSPLGSSSTASWSPFNQPEVAPSTRPPLPSVLSTKRSRPASPTGSPAPAAWGSPSWTFGDQVVEPSPKRPNLQQASSSFQSSSSKFGALCLASSSPVATPVIGPTEADVSPPLSTLASDMQHTNNNALEMDGVDAMMGIPPGISVHMGETGMEGVSVPPVQDPSSMGETSEVGAASLMSVRAGPGRGAGWGFDSEDIRDDQDGMLSGSPQLLHSLYPSMDHPSARLPHHRRHHHLAASTTNSSSSASPSLVAASASTLASSAASAFLPPSFQLPSAAQTPASTPHHSPQHAPLQSLPPPQLLSHHSFDSIPRAPEGPAVPVPIAHHHPRPLQPPPPRTGGPGASGTHHQGHYTMGPRADCDKCRAGVRGHWGHWSGRS